MFEYLRNVTVYIYLMEIVLSKENNIKAAKNVNVKKQIIEKQLWNNCCVS